MNKTQKKTSPDYWESIWQDYHAVKGINPSDKTFNNFVNRRLHLFFNDFLKTYFSDKPINKLRLLEVGCAGSAWLAYFAKNYDMEVFGIDYSEKGCELSKKILENERTKGEIFKEDLFNPSPKLLQSFDIVFSFGLVEHFNPISSPLSQCSKFLNRQGIMITIIPNMKGIYGLIQKKIDLDIYNAHMPVNLYEFIKEHENAGLMPLLCQYLIFFNLGMINIEKIRINYPLIWNFLWRLRAVINRIFWFFEMKLPCIFKANSMTSPYIICISTLKK